jgi:hypothetical protein
MKIKEFRMLVHGPFATNTYLDLSELEELRRLSLARVETDILETIKKKPYAEQKIIEQFSPRYSTNEIQDAIKSLKSRGFVELRESVWDKFTISRYSDGIKKLSPTSDGYDELRTIEKFSKLKKDISFDGTILTTFLKGRNFESVKLEDSKNSYPQFSSYFFSNGAQGYVVAKFSIPTFTQTISSFSPNVELKFENNTIHIFASGIGIFSSQITVTFSNEVDIANIKHAGLEYEVRKQIENIFESNVRQVINEFSKEADDKFQLVQGLFDFDDSKVANLAWLHTIYWFYNDGLFKDDGNGLRIFDREYLKYFTILMKQKLDNPLDMQDQYVFFGLERSLVLTMNDVHLNQNWVNEIGSLIEIGQYFCFGLNLLEYFLSRKISELMVDEPIIEQHPNKLKAKIESLERTRLASARYMEQFRSGIKALLHAGQIPLVDKLENDWRLQSIQDNILVKLKTIEKELSSREQSLLVHRQDRFSNIAFVFTVISLASVMGGVVALSPLKDQFHKVHPMFFFSSELFFVMFSTIAVISVTMYLVMKSYGLRKKIRSVSTKIVRRTYTERETTNRYTKKIDQSSRLYQNEEKEVLSKYRDQLRKGANASYRAGKINKANLRNIESKLDHSI